MTTLLPNTFDAIMADKEHIVYNIRATMGVFPLCCSTGVLKNLGASNPTENQRASFEANEKITGVGVAVVKKAKYIHEIIRECEGASRPVLFPIEMARWNALSLILLKTIVGTDDEGPGGYRNYKAAQITMCDRVCADKRNKKFAFGGYNIIFSTDQLMDWLDDTANPPLGEFYASPAVPGGHGARVRAGIYTPHHQDLTRWHDQRIERVRDHVLEYITAPKGTIRKAADKVASGW